MCDPLHVHRFTLAFFIVLGGALSDDSIPLAHHVAKKKKKRLKFLDSDESGAELKNGETFVKKRKKVFYGYFN